MGKNGDPDDILVEHGPGALRAYMDVSKPLPIEHPGEERPRDNVLIDLSFGEDYENHGAYGEHVEPPPISEDDYFSLTDQEKREVPRDSRGLLPIGYWLWSPEGWARYARENPRTPNAGAPRESMNAGPVPGQEAPPEIITRRASDITPEPISWIWKNWIARGKLHIIGGVPETGKTTIALASAAIVSSGATWPDGTRAAVGNVLIWTSEDDPADTLVPRLIRMGADLSRIHFIEQARPPGGKPRPFNPATDMPALVAKAAAIGGVVLLILDRGRAADSELSQQCRDTQRDAAGCGLRQGRGHCNNRNHSPDERNVRQRPIGATQRFQCFRRLAASRHGGREE